MPPDRTFSPIERANADDEAAAADRSAAPLPPFPADCLPPILRNQAEAIAEMCGIPVAMTAPMVLATASAALGRGILVKQLRGHRTPPNLYVIVAKASGSGGSTAFSLAAAPLTGKQALLRREFDDEKRPALAAKKIRLEEAIGAAKKSFRNSGDELEIENAERDLVRHLADLEEVERDLHAPLLVASDATSEGMTKLLSLHGETLAHFDSDASDALGSIMGRYNDARHTADTLWLKAYTGDTQTVGRGGAQTLHIETPSLAVLWVATPDKIAELYASERLTQGGLLPRCLVCDPKARPVPIDPATAGEAREMPADASQPYEAAIFTALDTFHPCGRSAADDEEALVIDMESGARLAFVDDFNAFAEGYTEETDTAPFESRRTENATRIALVLHVYANMEVRHEGGGLYRIVGNHGAERDMKQGTATDAIRIRDWFDGHFAALTEPRRVAAADAKWSKLLDMFNTMPDGITRRDLYNGKRVARTAAEAQQLLDGWVSEGRIVPEERKGARGRGKIVYKLTRKKK